MEPGPRRKLVVASVMLGMFLAALEATAVAAAMPTVVGDLGGVGRFSWVFSAYLLTTTATVPLYGKLADLFGRRKIYAVAVVLFCLGSALSGAARSIVQLILFRAIQGLGAGGVMPVAVTVIGDIFDLEERGRMQGLFSAVWGTSSLVGPALGGVVTDLLSWRWVFYLNIPFGIASAVLLALTLPESTEESRDRRLDLVGVASLVVAVTLLLFSLLEGTELWGWTGLPTLALFAASGAAALLFLRQERRAAEPMLPVELFSSRLVGLAALGSVGIGAIIYTASAYVPIFGQGVLRGTAVDAGLLLAPVSVGWPIASAVSGRLILPVGYRRLLLAGGSIAVVGTALLAAVDAASGRLDVMIAMLVLGLGLGLTSTPQIVAVQSAVPWRSRGAATSSLQFFRAIGGAVAVAAFGALLNARLRLALGTASLGAADADALLDPGSRSSLSPAALEHLSAALLSALQPVYLGLVAVAVGVLTVALAFPRGSARSQALTEPAQPAAPAASDDRFGRDGSAE